MGDIPCPRSSIFLVVLDGQELLSEDWKSPAIGLWIAKSIVKFQKVKIVPFTDAELSVIFSSSEFKG